MDLSLYISNRFTGIAVRPDVTYPGMYRIHHGDRVSDMVNLSRAKDAALSWAFADRKGRIGGKDVVTWRTPETPGKARQHD